MKIVTKADIVAGLQARNVNALGLTGADMDVLRSHKRPLKAVTMDDGTEQLVDFGFGRWNRRWWCVRVIPQ